MPTVSESLIPILNQVQDALAALSKSDGQTDGYGDITNSLRLPQIVVVGAQSVGKSSLLESIVNKDFLPRGQGMVTRCPLVLQMHRRSGSHGNTQMLEWGEFDHVENKKFLHFEEIKREITHRTSTLICGGGATGSGATGSGISDKPIVLKLYGPNFIDISLVDLPGLIKIPTADLPQRSVDAIQEMVNKYISNPNSIILAVSAANVDLANSDALLAAHQHDPTGSRTIGVITKCDTVDDAKQLLEVAKGNVYHLARGYVLTRCRTQNESDQGVTLSMALDREKVFFKTHPILSTLSVNHTGIECLSQKLTELLSKSITREFPRIKREVENELQRINLELDKTGEDVNQNNAMLFLVNLFRKFSTNMENNLQGRTNSTTRVSGGTNVNSGGNSVTPSHLNGGARLNFVFHEWFALNVLNFNALAGLNDSEIAAAIQNSYGVSGALFLPEASFEQLIRKQIFKLEEPSLQCVYQVASELDSMVQSIFADEWKRFTNLGDYMRDAMSSVLDECLKNTVSRVSDLIRVEMSMINKTHPDFIGGKNGVSLELLRKEIDDGEAKRQKENRGGGQGGGGQGGGQINMASNPSTNAGNPGNAGNPSGNPSANPIPTSMPSTVPNGPSPTPSLFAFLRRQQTPVNLEAEQNTGGGRLSNLADKIRGGDRGVDRPGNPETPKDASKDAHGAKNRMEKHSARNNSVPSVPILQAPRMDRLPTIETELIKALITSYFAIVRRNIADLVPKTIMCFLVNDVITEVPRSLTARLLNPDLFAVLVQENPEVVKNRRLLQRRQTALESVRRSLASCKP